MNVRRNGTIIGFFDVKNIDICYRTIRHLDGIIRRFVGIIRSCDKMISHIDGIIRSFEVNYSQFRRELSAVSSRIIGRFDEILTIFCDI